MIRRGLVSRLGLYLTLAACLGLVPAAAGAATTLGQTASPGTLVDGLRVPSGTTLLSPALVETGSSPAVVHLRNGRVVAVGEESQIRMDSTDSGAVEISVQTGQINYRSDTGRVITVAANELVLLDQEDPVQEGARVEAEEEERLCELQNWTAALWRLCSVDDPSDKGCDWDLIEVPMSEVPKYLDKTAVLACKDRNDLGLECDCEGEVIAAFPWWKVGAGVGAAAAAVVLYEEVIDDDDDERPASPSTP